MKNKMGTVRNFVSFSVMAAAVAGFLIFLSSSCVTTPSLKSKPDIDFNSLRDVTNLPQGENTYTLKGGILYLAGKSQVTLTLESYCLDVDKEAPDKDEIYYLAPGPPKAIPLYREIISYVAEHPREQKQGFVQNLLWNIRNDVKFENLSKAEQDFLLHVDELAPLKINSRLKESLWKKLAKFIGKILPFSGSDIIPAIKGRSLSFHEYADRIRNLSEKNVVPTPVKYDMIAPQPIGDTGLFGIAYTRGYSKIKIVIYNPSNPKRFILKFVDWVTKEWQDAMREATKGWEKLKKQDVGTAGVLAEEDDE